MFVSKGSRYERHSDIIDKTSEEIFGGSDAAVGDKLDGERRSGTLRRGDHRLRVGGVLYCVDGGTTPIDHVDGATDGETTMAAPGNGFYADPNKGIDEMRIAYVLKKEDLEKALNILKRAIEAYPGRLEAIRA